MSFFDSPKNKAMWEREMAGLRKERARREIEGYKPVIEEKHQEVSREETPFRRKISLKELEERMGHTSQRVNRAVSRQREMAPARAREKEADVLKGRAM